MTPEQQAKEAERANKDLIERTVKIPLTDRQLAIINEMKKEQKEFTEKLQASQKKEQDIISFVLEFKGLDIEELENVSLDGKSIVVVRKPEPKKEEEKEEVSENIGPMEEAAKMIVEENHK